MKDNIEMMLVFLFKIQMKENELVSAISKVNVFFLSFMCHVPCKREFAGGKTLLIML